MAIVYISIVNLKPFSYDSTSLSTTLRLSCVWDGLSLSFLITSVSRPQNGKEGCYEKWRVENSWGDDRGNKGEGVTICMPLIYA